MNVGLQEQCAKSIPTTPVGHSPDCLFVSTSLTTWKTTNPVWFARDFQINETAYRRLDPEYYAWLRSRMVLAKKAASSGHLDAISFEDLRARFNTVHDWAVDYFAEDQLLEAVRTLRAGDYKPPIADEEGPRIALPRAPRSAGEHISPEAIALVDAIGERALLLGWKHERLHGTAGRGGFDPQRGLVCYLRAGDRIGEVTLHSIEIIHPLPAEVRHRFYNPDVEQPWIKKIARFEQKDEKASSAPGISS